jgi:hypothetical protein
VQSHILYEVPRDALNQLELLFGSGEPFGEIFGFLFCWHDIKSRVHGRGRTSSEVGRSGMVAFSGLVRPWKSNP